MHTYTTGVAREQYAIDNLLKSLRGDKTRIQEVSIENFVPKSTDTVTVIQKVIKAIRTMLKRVGKYLEGIWRAIRGKTQDVEPLPDAEEELKEATTKVSEAMDNLDKVKKKSKKKKKKNKKKKTKKKESELEDAKLNEAELELEKAKDIAAKIAVKTTGVSMKFKYSFTAPSEAPKDLVEYSEVLAEAVRNLDNQINSDVTILGKSVKDLMGTIVNKHTLLRSEVADYSRQVVNTWLAISTMLNKVGISAEVESTPLKSEGPETVYVNSGVLNTSKPPVKVKVKTKGKTYADHATIHANAVSNINKANEIIRNGYASKVIRQAQINLRRESSALSKGRQLAVEDVQNMSLISNAFVRDASAFTAVYQSLVKLVNELAFDLTRYNTLVTTAYK